MDAEGFVDYGSDAVVITYRGTIPPRMRRLTMVGF